MDETYAVLKTHIIAQLENVKLPYNVNYLSHAAANFFLDHQDEFIRHVAEIIKRRDELYPGLKEIIGIKANCSRTNFIFFSCAFDSNNIYSKLVTEGMIVKNLNLPPLMPDCMRVTIGIRHENEVFLRT